MANVESREAALLRKKISIERLKLADALMEGSIERDQYDHFVGKAAGLKLALQLLEEANRELYGGGD